MNLIDFRVTKIISEEKDKVYKLFEMTEDQVNEITESWWKEYLLGNGIKQIFEYWDESGINVDVKIFNLDKQQEPYYIGFVGQH